MKVTELFEEYKTPERNPKLGFSQDAKIPTGGTKEWLKSFGATKDDIAEALKLVKKSDAYKAVRALGMDDQSSGAHDSRGSIMFVGHSKRLAHNGWDSHKRIKLTLQPNGKIDETSRNDFHRYPMASGKPRIVPGNPVASIQKTMEAALTKMASILTKRLARDAKEYEAAKKARAAGAR